MSRTQRYGKGETELKRIAREDTLFTAIRRSGIQDFKIVSLCARQYDTPASEINQLVDNGLIASKRDYTGIDVKQELCHRNQLDHPDATFIPGDISWALRKVSRADGRPVVAYLDLMGLNGVFWKGPGIHKPDQDEVAELIADGSGELPSALHWLRPGDLAIVNVQSAGRGLDRDMYKDGDIPDLFVPLLERTTGVRHVGLMNHSGRNLAGRTSRYYTYKSGGFNFTSFALKIS